MSTVVSVKNLVKGYGSFIAVDHLSFEIQKGEVFGILGHNGAGKTTTIDCILGVKPMDAGEVQIFGTNMKKRKKELFERIGVQFQQAGYHDKIKVNDICEQTEVLYKHTDDYRMLLMQFGLSEKVNCYVSELSGGERQKLSVLLALIPKPELVFLDELTTGLDAQARRDVWNILKEMKKHGLTILMTSHFMDEVEILCDKVLILKNGIAVAKGTVEEIVDQSPYENLEEAYLWYSNRED